MPTSSEIDLLRQNSMAVLEPSEDPVAIGREQIFPRRQKAFDAMDSHSQADEPPPAFVMEFNAAEREWHEARARLNKMLEDIESSLRGNEAHPVISWTQLAEQGR
jgi:hypothetical protein